MRFGGVIDEKPLFEHETRVLLERDIGVASAGSGLGGLLGAAVSGVGAPSPGVISVNFQGNRAGVAVSGPAGVVPADPLE